MRIRNQVDLTGTFKYSKTELVSEGYDPGACADQVYFDSPEVDAFIPVDRELYRRIQQEEFRL
jgi:hypothetical protein